MSMNLHNIERLNYRVGAVAVLLSLIPLSMRFSLGVAVGVILTCVNFAFLARVVAKVSSENEIDQRRLAWIPLKMLVLVGLTLGALLTIPMSPIGFGLGFLIFVVSILIDMAMPAKANVAAAAIIPSQPLETRDAQSELPAANSSTRAL